MTRDQLTEIPVFFTARQAAQTRFSIGSAAFHQPISGRSEPILRRYSSAGRSGCHSAVLLVRACGRSEVIYQAGGSPG